MLDLFCFQCSSFFLGLEEAFQLGYQQQAHQRSRKAAVVQAVAAVKVGYGGNHAVVENTGQDTVLPAVLVTDGTQTVGIAQAGHDRLGIDGLGEGSACQLRDPAEYERGQHIANHDGPDITGMRTGIAAGQHAEDQAEGYAVKAGAHQIVVAQNEQTVDTGIHQEGSIAALGGHIRYLIRTGQQLPVVLRCTAHQKRHDDAGAKNRAAENVHSQPGSNLQRLRSRGSRQGHTGGFIQQSLQQEGGHTHRHRRIIQVKALVNLGRMRQSAGQAETDDNAHSNSQQNAGQVETNGFRIGIAEHQLRNQRGNAGGEQHSIDQRSNLLLLHQRIDHHAQEGRPDVQHIDTPGAEAGSQQKCQGGYLIDHRTGDAVQQQADQAHQAHIQEGCSITAHGEIVGGYFGRIAHDRPQAGEHVRPVWHTDGSDQKTAGDESKEQFQKAAFRELVQFFHNAPHCLFLILSGLPDKQNGQSSLKLNCPDGRHKTLTLPRGKSAKSVSHARGQYYCMKYFGFCQLRSSALGSIGPQKAGIIRSSRQPRLRASSAQRW